MRRVVRAEEENRRRREKGETKIADHQCAQGLCAGALIDHVFMSQAERYSPNLFRQELKGCQDKTCLLLKIALFISIVMVLEIASFILEVGILVWLTRWFECFLSGILCLYNENQKARKRRLLYHSISPQCLVSSIEALLLNYWLCSAWLGMILWSFMRVSVYS